NRQIKQSLLLLRHKGDKPTFFDANFIEDAALITFSRMSRDGFLKPSMKVEMLTVDGQSLTNFWREKVGDPLPRDIQVKELHFHVQPGLLYHYDRVDLHGLTVLE